MPEWLLEPETGRISVNFVIAGLVAEVVMLTKLAFVFFKTPRSSGKQEIVQNPVVARDKPSPME